MGNLTIYKGAKSWRLPRTFVSFLLTHPVAKTYLDWSRLTYIPDEHVVPTLARLNLDSLFEENDTWTMTQDLVPLPRYHFQHWGEENCKGILRNSVCVFSLADLSTIVSAQSILVNKVMTEHDAAIGECLRDSVRKREMVEED